MSEALQIGQKLVEMCRAGKDAEFVDQYYSNDIISIEATPGPDGTREVKGMDSLKKKHEWWYQNFEIHSYTVEGPWPSGSGDQFIVTHEIDSTFKPENKREPMKEAALYTVGGGKILREEFFYVGSS